MNAASNPVLTRLLAIGLTMAMAALLAPGCGPKEPPAAAPPAPSRPGPHAANPAPAAMPHAQHTAAMETALRQRIIQDPNDIQAHLALGNLYFDSDRPHRAVAEYQIVLKAGPDSPNVRTDLGTCYKRMNQLDLARAQYERVLKDHPKHVMATFNLGVVVELQGNPRRAAELWERAAFLNPNSRVAAVALTHAAAARQAAAKGSAAVASPGANTATTAPTQ